MIRIMAACSIFALTACGVDGQPITPKYTTETTIGFNSKTGAFNKTKITIDLNG